MDRDPPPRVTLPTNNVKQRGLSPETSSSARHPRDARALPRQSPGRGVLVTRWDGLDWPTKSLRSRVFRVTASERRGF